MQSGHETETTLHTKSLQYPQHYDLHCDHLKESCKATSEAGIWKSRKWKWNGNWKRKMEMEIGNGNIEWLVS